VQELRQSIRDICLQETNLPPYFIKGLLVDQMGTEVLNKTAELDLAVATRLSDQIVDDVLNLLEQCNQKLVSGLNC
jgi:CARMIL C-terminus